MPALLTQTGVLCSATFSLSTGDPQNLWTQNALPAGKAVITGFVARDTVGIQSSAQFFTLFCSVNNVPGALLYFMPNAAGGPGYSQSTAITPSGLPLMANPTVTGQVVSTINNFPGNITIDVIGYYI